MDEKEKLKEILRGLGTIEKDSGVLKQCLRCCISYLFFVVNIVSWYFFSLIIWKAFLFGGEGGRITLVFNYDGEMILELFLFTIIFFFTIGFSIVIGIRKIKEMEK